MQDDSYKKVPPKKLKNLNWIIDSYQHIPVNFNKTQKELNSDHPQKPYFILYELTRFKPNKWVEEKPPEKPTKKQEIKKAFDLGVKLQLKKYSSTQDYKDQLQKRKEKLKQELDKLSSVKIFDQQLTSRNYSIHEKKILKSVRCNALKSITQRINKENPVNERLSPLYRLSKLGDVEKQFENLLKKSAEIPSSPKMKHLSLHSTRKRLLSTM